jgi:hypothetical protein
MERAVAHEYRRLALLQARDIFMCSSSSSSTSNTLGSTAHQKQCQTLTNNTMLYCAESHQESPAKQRYNNSTALLCITCANDLTVYWGGTGTWSPTSRPIALSGLVGTRSY